MLHSAPSLPPNDILFVPALSVFLYAVEWPLQLAETRSYELDALQLPTEDTVVVTDLCHDADSNDLFIADYANRCVKAVAASGRPALVFQCGADSRPRALQLVRPVAGGGAALLLVVWLEAEQQAARYALLVAARNGQRFEETGRLLLPALAKDFCSLCRFQVADRSLHLPAL